MAIGADRAILVECADELQPLAVAKLLKALVDKEQPGLVIVGKQAIDDDCNQTARCWPRWPDCRRAPSPARSRSPTARPPSRAEVDGGVETVRLKLPAVVTTDLRLNEPRYVTLPTS